MNWLLSRMNITWQKAVREICLMFTRGNLLRMGKVRLICVKMQQMLAK